MSGLASDPTSQETRRPGRRRRVRQSSRTRELVGISLLVAALVGSALLFGAQQTPVLIVAALAASASAWLLRGSKLPRPAWLLVGLAVYTLVQILPMPYAWVARLSPASAEVWAVSASTSRSAACSRSRSVPTSASASVASR